jgi:hypothetical protein
MFIILSAAKNPGRLRSFANAQDDIASYFIKVLEFTGYQAEKIIAEMGGHYMLLKKAIAALLLSVLMITSIQLSYAADDSLVSISGAVLNDQLNFKLNGVNVIPVGDDGTPVLPISYNGTTYLPIRAIGYLLGLGIDYEGSTKSVLITSSTSKVPPAAIQSTKTNQLIPITNVVLNKALKFKLDAQPVIPSGDDGTPVLPVSYNGTTYLPVRAIGNLLNLGISYDGNTKTVLITKQNPAGGTPITQNPTGNTPVTQNPAGSTTITQSKVWKLKEVKFTDATSYKESVLMGTSSYMYDTIGFTGDQNDLIIFHNRNDKETNKALAGIKYQVTWTNPPEYLAVGQTNGLISI